jgi:multidrug resistance protein
MSASDTAATSKSGNVVSSSNDQPIASASASASTSTNPNKQAHIPPTFFMPRWDGDRTTTPASRSVISRTRSRPKAYRTPSQREIYDADSASICGESGSYSSHRDNASLYRQPSIPIAPRRGSSRFQAHPGGLVEEAHEYIANDARERGEEEEILDDVRRGNSGESFRDALESQNNHSSSKVNRVNVDLEKQVESSSLGEKDSKGSSDTAINEKDHEEDPNLITWDSPESQENPRNWSLHRRWSVIVIVSSYTFLSPLSSSMIAPALPTISREFNVTSSVLESLMLSVFVLAYAVGPLFLAPLSEMFGRRIVLQLSNAFFIVFTVACAVAQDRVQLSIFRFFAGLGGSAPLTIGGGTVSDLMVPEERGVAMSIYSLGPLMGPALGPIIGGWIIQETGKWRWIFGVASIAAGFTAAIGLFILPETYAPIILEKKAKKLRKESGNPKLHTVFDLAKVRWQEKFRHNMVRPFILIATQPIIIVLGVYLMVIYGCMYLVLTSFDAVFQDVYGESVGIASLNYLALAIGFTAGGQICGRANDYNYKRLKALNNGVGKPEFKLPVMMVTCWMPAVGLLINGWTAEYHTHWIGPDIGACILAFGMIATFQCIQTYTVDSYSLYAASALSANTFLRSLAGFALPLGSGALYANLGYGYGNTVLGLIAAVIGIPAPFLLYKYGERIRAKSQYAAD